MENFKIITVENNESFVTIDTLVSFSGNAEVAVRQLLRDNESDIMDFSEKILNFNGFSGFRRINANSKTIDWDKVRLNEDQASYLLTLMKNSPEVKTFKKNLIKEFRALKNQKQKNLTPIEHMAIANKMLLDFLVWDGNDNWGARSLSLNECDSGFDLEISLANGYEVRPVEVGPDEVRYDA